MRTVKLWAGVDVGKRAHHCVVIDEDGNRLLSSRVANDEPELLALLDSVQKLREGAEITWGTDLNRGPAALLLTLLRDRQQTVIRLSGRAFHHAAASYPGGRRKTDARDARVIADQVRMRRDLQPMVPVDEIALELRLLSGRRTALTRERARAINRLRGYLLEYFPALERAFDFKQSKGAVVLVSGYQTPDALRAIGAKRLEEWLRDNNVRAAEKVAAVALTAAESQHAVVPGQRLFATFVKEHAIQIQSLDAEIAGLNSSIEVCFRRHKHAELILSMPGFGVTLGADFIAGTGGDLAAYGSADRLAGACGLAPVPHDSGETSGNNRRPTEYNRQLLRACYLSASVASRWDEASGIYYRRKRAEGKKHVQAVLSLARRRVNVLWAMLRDGTPYHPRQPV